MGRARPLVRKVADGRLQITRALSIVGTVQSVVGCKLRFEREARKHVDDLSASENTKKEKLFM